MGCGSSRTAIDWTRGEYFILSRAVETGQTYRQNPMRTELPTQVLTGQLERSKVRWCCWRMRAAKVELSNLSDSNRNLAGYGLPVLVTRSPGEG